MAEASKGGWVRMAAEIRGEHAAGAWRRATHLGAERARAVEHARERVRDGQHGARGLS